MNVTALAIRRPVTTAMFFRPGGLSNGPALHNGSLFEENITGMIRRADVALLIIEILENDDSIGKTYHAVAVAP